MGTRVGTGPWTYEVVPNWGRNARRPAFGIVSGVACDRQDNVYVFQRTIEPSVIVFDREGNERRQWGVDTFRHPHGIWIGPDATRGGEEVVLVTDRDLHQVIKYSLTGEQLALWGDFRAPGDHGEPFNQPARATLGPGGEMFVADGYGQYRTHRFGPDGTLQRSWGHKGTGPSEFGWPVHHALVDPRGRLLVIDRGNNRIQLFTPEGDYLDEWGGLHMPQDFVITPQGEVVVAEGSSQTIAVLDLDGKVLGRWGESGDGPGQFAASPHSLWLDSRGDLYVGEVITPDRFQKFVRV
jgi:DNA-binding beta-propeller fold protein YncE